MSLTTSYHMAAQAGSGFGAEQVLFNMGFYETGRRTDAVAWTKRDNDLVIRISREAEGSYEFFALAQKMAGNPYMPIVVHQDIMPSGEHIACVEKLINGCHKEISDRFYDIREHKNMGNPVTDNDQKWFEEIAESAKMSQTISNFFMATNFELDISTLPQPGAFREASVAILELCEDMNKKYRGYIPGPDFNPTNIMWRRTNEGLVPVLYDPVKRQDGHGKRERDHTNLLREKLGMNPLSP